MASKLKLISELYEETIKDVSQDSRQWLDFLKCASMNYKYNFSEQLLIYAQKPNAIACADLETWNKTLNRWINKGAKGCTAWTNRQFAHRIAMMKKECSSCFFIDACFICFFIFATKLHISD